MRPINSLEATLHELDQFPVQSFRSPEDYEFLRSKILPELSTVFSTTSSEVNERAVSNVRKRLLERFLNTFKPETCDKIPDLIAVAYECLRTLTYLSPINEHGVISLEPVCDSDMVLCADGYKLNLIEDLLAFTLNRSHNIEFDYFDRDHEEFRTLSNPFTRQPLHFLDSNSIAQYVISQGFVERGEIAFQNSQYFFSKKVLNRLVPDDLKSHVGRNAVNENEGVAALNNAVELLAQPSAQLQARPPAAPRRHFSRRLYFCYVVLCGYLSYLSANYIYTYTRDYYRDYYMEQDQKITIFTAHYVEGRGFDMLSASPAMCLRSTSLGSLPLWLLTELRNTYSISLLATQITFMLMPLFPQGFFRDFTREVLPINLELLSPLMMKLAVISSKTFTACLIACISIFLGKK